MLSNCDFRDDFSIPNDINISPCLTNNSTSTKDSKIVPTNTHPSSQASNTTGSYLDTALLPLVESTDVQNTSIRTLVDSISNAESSLFNSNTYSTFQPSLADSTPNSYFCNDQQNVAKNPTICLSGPELEAKQSDSIVKTANSNDIENIISQKSPISATSDPASLLYNELNLSTGRLQEDDSCISAQNDASFKLLKKAKQGNKRKLQSLPHFGDSDMMNRIDGLSEKISHTNKRKRCTIPIRNASNNEDANNENKLEKDENLELNSVQANDDIEIDTNEIEFKYLSKKHRQLQFQNCKSDSKASNYQDQQFSPNFQNHLNSFVSSSLANLNQLNSPKIDFNVHSVVNSAPQSSQNTSSSFRTKKPKALPEKATKLMKDWYEANRHNPYPTDEERRIMSEQGEINENQVKAWFANKRNRSSNTKSKAKANKSLNLTDSDHTQAALIENLSFNAQKQIQTNDLNLNLNLNDTVLTVDQEGLSKAPQLAQLAQFANKSIYLKKSLEQNVNPKTNQIMTFHHLNHETENLNLKQKSKFLNPKKQDSSNLNENYFQNHLNTSKKQSSSSHGRFGQSNQSFIANSYQAKPNRSSSIELQANNDDSYSTCGNNLSSRYLFNQTPQHQNNFNSYYIYNQQQQQKYQVDLNNNYTQNFANNLNTQQTHNQQSLLPYMNHQNTHYNDCFNSNRYQNNIYMNVNNKTNLNQQLNENLIGHHSQNNYQFLNHQSQQHHHHQQKQQCYDSCCYTTIAQPSLPSSLPQSSCLSSPSLNECTVCISCNNESTNVSNNPSSTPNISLNPINPSNSSSALSNQQFRCDTPPPLITISSSTNAPAFTSTKTNSSDENAGLSCENLVVSYKNEDLDVKATISNNNNEEIQDANKHDQTDSSPISANSNDYSFNKAQNYISYQNNSVIEGTSSNTKDQHVYQQSNEPCLLIPGFQTQVKHSVDSINFYNYSFNNATTQTFSDFVPIQSNSTKSPIVSENLQQSVEPMSIINSIHQGSNFNPSFYAPNDFIANTPTININNINYSNPNSNLFSSLSNILNVTKGSACSSVPSSSASSSPPEIEFVSGNVEGLNNNSASFSYKDILSKNSAFQKYAFQSTAPMKTLNRQGKYANVLKSNLVNMQEQDSRFTDLKAKEWCMKSHPRLSNTLLNSVPNNLIQNQFTMDLIQANKKSQQNFQTF